MYCCRVLTRGAIIYNLPHSNTTKVCLKHGNSNSTRLSKPGNSALKEMCSRNMGSKAIQQSSKNDQPPGNFVCSLVGREKEKEKMKRKAE